MNHIKIFDRQFPGRVERFSPVEIEGYTWVPFQGGFVVLAEGQTLPTQAEWDSAVATYNADMVALDMARAASAHRVGRANDYVRDLSPEGTFITSTGDTMDAIIKELRDLRAMVGGTPNADFAAKTNVIDAIKQRYPKP